MAVCLESDRAVLGDVLDSPFLDNVSQPLIEDLEAFSLERKKVDAGSKIV